MSTQKFRDALEAFEPGAGNATFVCTNTEVNDRILNALAGRKLRLWTSGTTVVIVVSLLIVLATAVLAAVLTTTSAGAAPAPIMFVFLIPFLLRTTLITITDSGLSFYFLDIKLGKYAISDKLVVPFEQITSIHIKTGKVFKNTHVTLGVMVNGKARKLKTSAARRMRNMPEHQDNLQALLQALAKLN